MGNRAACLSSQDVWAKQANIEQDCVKRGARNRECYRRFAGVKMWPYGPNVDYSVKWLADNLDAKAMAATGANSYFRKEKPDISLKNTLPDTTGKGANHSTKRRKSAATTRDANESPPPHSRGGGNRGDRIKMCPQRANL